ncbi:hypothetical protein GUJ93_ZPchr0012g20321 [Zizania palustris]|uniref:Uncharacterized protein n=1 Tax=Zizania palustris TaxID=103762 RepID=A0A8J6BSX6_ZIZPA|nr:hypothetical protein GUJ93_ZPchr0012g20321 [Zizania palustris]
MAASRKSFSCHVLLPPAMAPPPSRQCQPPVPDPSRRLPRQRRHGSSIPQTYLAPVFQLFLFFFYSISVSQPLLDLSSLPLLQAKRRFWR